MSISKPSIAIAAIAFVALTFAPQPASARYACGVKPTPDGFVALREGVGAGTKMIARMKKGEVVTLLHPPEYEKLIRKGNWIFVRYIPGSQFARVNDTDHDKAIPGWVNNNLIDCPE